jgi:hypothetical protein
MKRTVFNIALFPILFSLNGCAPIAEDMPPLSPAALVYMVADNNLDYYAMANIKQMERGLPDNAEGHIFVFITRNMSATTSHPYLLKITRNTEGGAVTSPIIQVYRQQNTCDPYFLRQVIADVKKHCKAYNAELRRLVLWSHGTGWLPEGTPFNDIDNEEGARGGKTKTAASLYSFGLDNTGNGDGSQYAKEMDIKDLAAALAGERFELLILDACFMGAVEVAYELRNVCDYLLVSPTEIVSSGFPYEDIAGYITASVIEPLAIAIKFFNYYNNQKATLQSAAISVINTRYLTDLAQRMKTVYSGYSSCKDAIITDTMPQYDRTASNYFFDFRKFINYVSEQTENDYSEILNIYDKLLPFYLHTSKIFGILDLAGTSGLSIYIPNTFTIRSELHEYYKSLSWAQDSQALLLFN